MWITGCPIVVTCLGRLVIGEKSWDRVRLLIGTDSN